MSKEYQFYTLNKYGSPENLHLKQAEKIPMPNNNEVCIQVHYTSVSFTDTMIRKGLYPDNKVKPPFTPGYECAGIVVGCGEEVSPTLIGKKVSALSIIGAHSEYINLDSKKIVILEDKFPLDIAVSLQLSYISAYQMLKHYRKLSSESSILITAAGGAVGLAMIQIAKAMGIQVYGLASGKKIKTLTQMGCISYNYNDPNSYALLKNEIPGGFDAIFDCVGFKSLKKIYNLLKPDGSLISYGFLQAMQKKETFMDIIKGFTMLKLWNLFPNKKKTNFYSIIPFRNTDILRYRDDIADLIKLWKQKLIAPPIDRYISFQDITKGHKIIENETVLGKVLVKTRFVKQISY